MKAYFHKREMMRLYKRGYSTREIAKVHGIHWTRVWQILTDYGKHKLKGLSTS